MRDSTIADLARSGLTPEDAEAAGMFDVADASTIYPEFRREPALIIPYFEMGSGAIVRFGPAGKAFCRVRYLETLEPAASFKHQKIVRYTQPAGSGVHAYFAPVIDWAHLLADVTEPLLLVEGEKKALAAIEQGFPVIGLGGVWNWGRGGELLPELDSIKWAGRDVYIVFDSDAALNPNILAAEARLVDELQRKRGAKCFLVRLPQVGESKIGVDDYLLLHGAKGLTSLLQLAPSLGALDAKVVALNKSVAWIERENLVYDLEAKMFMPKDSFVTGSRFSSLKHITVGGKQRSEPKEISIASKWLTHPHAQRFSEVLFRPGEGLMTQDEQGRAALNLWTGWDAQPGDVTPFLKLTEFLFQNMRGDDKHLPLKLLAYKAQNPQEKVPLAFVLLGPQGCGKTLWGECVRDAFKPYGYDVKPSMMYGEFQGWLERSLFVLINEATGEDMLRAAEQLKALISDEMHPMNEKFRPVRRVQTYMMYCITSNNRAVGAFAADDRRMIVIDCPPKMTSPEGEALYETLGHRKGQWHREGGPKKLLNYLLTLDLAGWAPPSVAPSSAEKYMAYVESLTPVQRLALEMKTSSEHTVKLWLDQAVAWAQMAEISNNPMLASMARATLKSVQQFEIRPWYTPEELALIFPSIVSNMLGGKLAKSTPSGAISRELRDAGVPYLVCADDPRGFRHKGQIKQYLVVSQFDDWRSPLRQNDFDRLINTCPTYGSLTKARG